MKILLLGEYSGVHSQLKKALDQEGYEVLLIHNGDGYKNFQADLFIKYTYISSKNRFLNKAINFYYILLAYSGLKGCIQIFKYIDVIKKMRDYDVVQLINPLYISDYGSIVNLAIFIYLKSKNKKIFLCALGDDYYWVKYCLDKNFEYSIFDQLSIRTFKNYSYPLQYIYGFLHPFLNKYIANNVNAVIPGLYDYYAAYKHLENCSEIVPIIIPSQDSAADIKPKFPIKIFHGWQPGKAFRKGNDIFDKAIKLIKEKYPNEIEYKIVGGLPYEEYIKTFNDCDIFIDQCYSQDCGVNALLGMSQGKVVFSGFEKEVQEYYGIDYMPIVNCKPDFKQIYNNIEYLIKNPSEIKKFSIQSKRFVKNFHNKTYVLNKYFEIWKNY